MKRYILRQRHHVRSVLGLSVQLATAQFKLKSEGTWLGVFWYLLNPILTFALLIGIFQDRLGSDIPQYPLYLLLGIVVFNFFQSVSGECAKLIRQKKGLINALNFPRESLVGAVVLKALFFHAFELIVVVGVLAWFGMLSWALIVYPVILLFLLVFSFGAGLILAAVGAYIFDLGEAWAFIVRLIWFGTPIFYAVGGQGTLLLLNMFNPMYFFITLAREVIVYTQVPDWWLVVGTVGYTILAVCIGAVIFRVARKRFAEIV